MKSPILYKLLIPLDKIFMSLYKVKYIGLNNIPKKESAILAGNHTSNLDSLLLMSCTNRCIHFLAKIELCRGIKKYFFNRMGIIPVDRSRKNPEAIKKANNYLKENALIGIFPEGTINRTENTIIPFKTGAVRMAHETNSVIVPFSITGKYKFLRKSVIICFGIPYQVTGVVAQDNEILEKKIIDLIRSNT